jgi:hypothetical protein
VTETIRYSRLFYEDLAVGGGTGQVTLADGRVVSMSEINLDLIADRLSRITAILPYKVLASQWYGMAGYATLDEALSAAGSATRTILVTTSTAITNTTSVPSNITLKVSGAGSFTVSSGVTFTIQGPLEAPFRQIFAGAGTVKFTYNVEVYSEWWGGISDGSTDSTDAVQAAITSGPSGGVVLRALAGSYNIDTTLTRTVPLTIQGAGIDVTTFQWTTNASLQHGISGTTSLTIRDCTIKMQTSLTTDQQMHAVRLDLDGTGLTGRIIHIENVKVRGFNVGLYCDGGADYGLTRAVYRNVDIQVSGDGTSYIGSCAYMNRVTQGEISLATLDQNDTGEHAVYCFGCTDIYIDGLNITNVTKSESQAIKLVGDATAATSAYGAWSIRNVNFSDCTNGILIGTYGTEVLRVCMIDNVGAKDIDGTANILGALHISAGGTSTINSVLVNNVYLENLGYQGMHVEAASGATVGRVEFANIWAKNWGTTSAGSYTLFGTNGTGTFHHIHLKNIYADGNSNGRTIVGVAGQSTTVGRVTWDNPTLIEVNTTAAGRPVQLTDLDTTPSLKLGNVFYVNNTGATTITGFDDLEIDQIYTLYFANNNTTLDNGSNIILLGGTDVTPVSGEIVQIYTHNGTSVYEVNPNRT